MLRCSAACACGAEQQCSGLPSTISYLAIVSLVPVFLGDGMPVDQADLKRRRRIASRVLVSGSRGGETDSEAPGPRPRPESELVNQLIVKPAETTPPSGTEIGTLLAEPVSQGPEPENWCSRCLRLLPRAVRLMIDASIGLA